MEKLKLQFPLKYWSVNQKFGANDTSVYSDLGMKGHSGCDAYAMEGTPVFACHDGRVTFAGYDGFGGLGVRIRTLKEFEYKDGSAYYETLFWHLQRDSLKLTGGQDVKAGDLIGLSGNTGLSTGPHLHLGLKPMKWQDQYNFTYIEAGNGYSGGINPEPYLPPSKFFTTKLALWQSGSEVEKLQAFLVRNGFLVMPPNTLYGYYGNLTREAVYKFQQKYVNLTPMEKLMRGSTVGTKTLEALNKLNDSL
jgi:hypothetical protein